MTSTSLSAPPTGRGVAWLAGGGIAIACAVAAAATVLLQVPPALAVAAAAAPGAGLVLLTNPRLATLVTAFVFLLPDGLLPLGAMSYLRLALLALAVLAWLSHSLRRPTPVVFPVPMALLTLLFIWSVVSVTWAPRTDLAVSKLVALFLVLTMTFLLLNTVTDRADVDAFMRTLAAVGWVLVAAGVLAMLTQGLGTGRLQVQATNANQYGNVLLLSCVGVLWLDACRAPREGPPVVAPAFLCAVAALIGMSGSRGSLLAFAILLLGLWAARRTRRTARVTTGVCLLLAAVAGPVIFATTVDRVRAPEPDQASRTTLWTSGLAVFADRPLQGVGTGYGPQAMPAYINARSDRDYFPDGRDSIPAHNPIIEVAVETGIVGGLLFLGALVSALTVFVTRLHRLRAATGLPVSPQAVAVAATTAAFLLVWAKSGGLGAHPLTFVLVVLWLVGAKTALPHGGSEGTGAHAGRAGRTA